ncbi:MAG TPA: oxaloacetate decarboxylase [Candidatus Methylomirabilis sp.]|nr:oxaloacetate decarboxylase [Candidatus Methylomirabilis sp.]
MESTVDRQGPQDTRKTTRLRRLLQGEDLVMAPGCFNALSALLIEQAGFPAIYITGAGLASNFLGYPDIGLVSMAEVLVNARNIVQVTSLPVICDVDTGFGNAINVIRTVREFEGAGVAGVQIEDQVMPKKCGHTEGKRLVSRAEMVQKVKAAVDSRRDPDFVIIARTDAIAVNGLEDAVERAQAYHEAGADILFVEAPRTPEEMRTITRTVRAPHLVNVVEGGGKTPVLPAKELQALGFRIAIYPVSLWTASIKAMQEVLAILKEDGITSRYASRMASFQEMFEIVGRSRFTDLERKYTADEP